MASQLKIRRDSDPIARLLTVRYWATTRGAIPTSFSVVGTGFGASPASISRIKSAITPPSVPLGSLPPMTSVFGMNGTLLFDRASTAFTNAVAFASKAATCLS